MCRENEIAVIDFDGTLINRDLGSDFGTWLKNSGHVERLFHLVTLPIGAANYLLRASCELPLGNRLLAQFDSTTLNSLFDEFLNEEPFTYVVNEALLEYVNSIDGSSIVLTGSPEILVNKFLTRLRVTTFETVIGQREGKFRWFFNPTPFGRAKSRFVNAPIGLAIADSYSDRFLLTLARTPIVIKGDSRLEALATKMEWQQWDFNVVNN